MKKILAAGACALACTGGAASLAGAATNYSGLDKQYLTQAIQGDRFEIQGAKLALRRRGTNAAVRKLARRLKADHTKSLSDDRALAGRLGIEVPKAPTASQQWELRVVATFRGRAFNRWYSGLEVDDHVQDISEATDEVQDGANGDVVASAKQEIPTLREHLKLARAAFKASK